MSSKADKDGESSRGTRNVQKHRNLHKLQTIVWYAWWLGFTVAPGTHAWTRGSLTDTEIHAETVWHVYAVFTSMVVQNQ